MKKFYTYIKESKKIGTSEKSNEEYGCLMAYLDLPNFSKLQSKINVDDFADNDKTLEDEPHITILYGFILDDPNYDNIKILNSVKKLITEPIDDIKIKNIGIFENEEYDVLKISVESKKLRSYNNFFQNGDWNLNVTYPDYNPHITIAYLKPGTGRKYLNLNPFILLKENEHFLTSNKIVYSEKDNGTIQPFIYKVDFDRNVNIIKN